MTPQPEAAPQDSKLSLLLLSLILLLTTTLSLLWSHARLLWKDEFLSFYSDGVATFKQVLLVQLHHPISLDPPTYHLLSHLCMDLIGRNAIALRLPALAGFLLFQLCLYFFVRRLAGNRAAVIAAAVPLLTASFRYSTEGRPYGLLLGLYALSLLCWSVATQTGFQPATQVETRSRLPPLVGLTLSIALAITSHYFGVLILIPVSLGELARIFTRKRLDFGVLAALILGLASVALILPFQKALMAYRQHYYIAGVNFHDISQGYRELFLRYTTWPLVLQKLAAALMVLLALALVYAGYQRFKRRPASEHAYTWVALAAMALLPLFGYLFGRFVTHTMEVRYVIAALIAFAATFAIVLEPRLRSTTFYYVTLALIFLAAIDINTWNIVKERRASDEILASFQLSPEASAALHQNPHELIYLQSLSDFYLDTYYDPDPTLRPRFSLIAGQDQEIHWLAHDTEFVTAENMHTFAPLSITTYADFRNQSHPLLLVHPGSWQWIDKQLAAEHTPQTPIAPALRGQLVRVTNPSATAN
jgi:4-amino-4-deoxy-L-arabinose transferase-like glycosyltransferase